MSAASNPQSPHATGPRAEQSKHLPIAKIIVGERQRGFDPDAAAAIAATLPELGLMQPIVVYAAGDGFKLVAGFHRLEACRMAGWEEVPAKIVQLDDAHLDASAALREAMENLMRGELIALDRMAHLWAAKRAHDEVYPNASKAGRPKKVTREAEDNLPSFGRFSFTKEAAERIGMARNLVIVLTTAYEKLSANSRMRLRGTRFADRQGEIVALSELDEVPQKLVLDRLLAETPEVSTVAEALARIMNEPVTSPEERRVTRYAETLGRMPAEQQDRILIANKEAVLRVAREQGWLS